MSLGNPAELPDLGVVLGQVLQNIPRPQQPLLIAIAERLAAQRYRDWSTAVNNASQQARLRACAEREEDIAGRVEGLYPDAAAIQRELLANNPGLEEINRNLFAGRPLAQQFIIQARGERLGAATWQAFAKHDDDASRRTVFLACADLEEASAQVLDAILADQP